MQGSSTIKRLAKACSARTSPWLRAYARLVFGEGPLEGLLLLVATLEHPMAGACGLLAVLVAQAVAASAGYAEHVIQSGYYGYNALLVGVALGQAAAPSTKLVLLVCGGAALAALLSAVLGDLLRRAGLPLLALPFVIVTSLFWHTTLEPDALPFWLLPHAPAGAPEPLARTVLAALGAIVLEPTTFGGTLVLAAALLRSRIIAAALVAGALIGVAVARGLSASEGPLVVAAAYNGALTFAAVGAAFFVPGRAALWVAGAAAAVTAWLAAALMLPFAPLSVPVLAWPFVLVTSCVMRGLGLRAPGRAPYPALLPGSAPESNLGYARTFAKRLGLPGPPRFVPPVEGAWRVTQGVDGAHTHRGPWRHALDFEVVDQEGFPFRGSGLALEDYYCFGQSVLAPGSGVVALVHDEAPDNPPGTQDLARPWGNAVVIQHGPALFSVVAHLRRGSITVAPGAVIAAGQTIAQCGSSGRSPRPHLHFQAQASSALGAATLDFKLVQYAVDGAPPRFERLGVPAEGETVLAPEPSPLPSEAAFPPAQLALFAADRPRVDLCHEVTLLGENSLVDLRRRERLFFARDAKGVVFTALSGAPDGVLGAILQIAPHLPTVSLPRLQFEEELAPEPLLPFPLKLAYQLLGVVVEPASAVVRGELVRGDDWVVIESECEVRFLGRVVRRRRGRIELDRHGLSSVELWSPSGRRPVVQVARAPSSRPVGDRIPDAGEAPPCAV